MQSFKFKQDLAKINFADYDKEVARRLFAREIHGNVALMAELEATGYHRSQKRLTPKQVGISVSLCPQIDTAPQVKATLAEPFHKVFLAE